MAKFIHTGYSRKNGCPIAFAEGITWDRRVLSIETRKFDGRIISRVEVRSGSHTDTRMEWAAGKWLAWLPQLLAVSLHHFWMKSCLSFLLDDVIVESRRC